MSIPLVMMLLGAVLFWIGYPAWRGIDGAFVPAKEGALQDLLLQKEALLTGARELDFDLQTDKLSPEDHRVFREFNKRQAVNIMQRLDKLVPSRDGSEIDAGPNFCATCGYKHRHADRFCTRCGHRLNEGIGDHV